MASMVPRASKHGNRWQYHPRSDHHSKIACWGLLLDLMNNCALLRSHAEKGIVGFGLNHEMRDFRTGRKKNLDLVLCRPRSETSPKRQRPRSFAEQAGATGAVLDSGARSVLGALPGLREFPVGAVHVAVEAKACMTEHMKALPRLYDELNSSHLAVHGSSEHTIAAGLAMVNLADSFISPSRNDFDIQEHEPRISRHNQPRDASKVIEKLRDLPRRNREGESGFDAFGITVVECHNDGTPVRLVEDPPAPRPGDIYHYEQMIHRLVHLYEQKFRSI